MERSMIRTGRSCWRPIHKPTSFIDASRRCIVAEGRTAADRNGTLIQTLSGVVLTFAKSPPLIIQLPRSEMGFSVRGNCVV